MSPVWLAIISVCLYGLANNFTSKYLRTTAPAANAMIMGFCMTVAASLVFAAQRTIVSGVRLPVASLWWVYVVCGVIYCLADLLFYRAYTLQGSVALLMTLVALMPVAAVLIEYFFFRGRAPSARQIAGIACAVLAAWLVSVR